MFAAQEEQWSKIFERMTSSSSFPEQLASALKTYLSSAALTRENVARYLEAANLPSRADIAALGRRLDDLTDLVQSLVDAVEALRRDGLPVEGKKKKKKDRKTKGKSH
jgi:hypothetical protein